MSAEHNPFAAPRSDPRFPASDDASLQIRRCYLEHEATIRLIGWLHILFGLFLLVSMVEVVWDVTEALLASPGRRTVSVDTDRFWTAVGVSLAGVVLTWNGFSLRRLGGKARIVAVVLYAVAFIACFFNLRLLVGLTIVAGYQIYCLCGPKGRHVCTPEYRRVVEKTPDLATQSFLTMLGILGLSVLLLSLYGVMILWLA